MTNSSPAYTAPAALPIELTAGPIFRTARLPFDNGITDEVTVIVSPSGSVTITTGIALDDEGFPTEGMTEVTIPAEAWAHLIGLTR